MNRLLIFSMCVASSWLTSQATAVETYRLMVTNGDRELPVKVYAPDTDIPSHLIIYSHGLGGSCETKEYLLRHWAESGFICVSVQHPGSDSSIWKNADRGNRLQSLKKATGLDQFINRTTDIPAALDQLEKWNAEKGHKLYKAIDFSKVGMSGHSFGAITSQAMMGADYLGKRFNDDRLSSFLLMSPSPGKSRNPDKSFGHIQAPVMVMTGTEDTSAITPDIDGAAREKVYETLPQGDKYMYVFDGGKHNLFSGPTRLQKRLKPEHKVVQDLSLLFWKTHLLGDTKAKKDLADYTARGKDRYSTK